MGRLYICLLNLGHLMTHECFCLSKNAPWIFCWFCLLDGETFFNEVRSEITERPSNLWSYNADGVCVQSIEHPACVWDVKFLENGDVVTACSDGAVRIWTSHGDRISDPHALEAYAVELSQYKNSRSARS